MYFCKECDQFVTDGHFENFQSLKVCHKESMICDVLVYDSIFFGPTKKERPFAQYIPPPSLPHNPLPAEDEKH